MRDILEQIRMAGGLRNWVHWKLWERNLRRCPHCSPMPRDEWEAMCDCFIPHEWWIR